MITEQHERIIKERNLIICGEKSWCFVYTKGKERIGRFFQEASDKVIQENVNVVHGTTMALDQVRQSILPYVLDYIVDYNLSLFYYQEGNFLKICSNRTHYESPILIRNHDNLHRHGKLVGSIRLTESRDPIDITDVVIKRNCHFVDFVILDNSVEELYISKKQILQFLEHETCSEAIGLACELLSANAATTDKILVPYRLLKRLKAERHQFYHDLKKGSVP